MPLDRPPAARDAVRRSSYRVHWVPPEVVKILIEPAPFAQWCEERGVLPDQAARLTFANEAAARLSFRLQ